MTQNWPINDPLFHCSANVRVKCWPGNVFDNVLPDPGAKGYLKSILTSNTELLSVAMTSFSLNFFYITFTQIQLTLWFQNQCSNQQFDENDLSRDRLVLQEAMWHSTNLLRQIYSKHHLAWFLIWLLTYLMVWFYLILWKVHRVENQACGILKFSFNISWKSSFHGE